MKVIDANVLLYAVNADTQRHVPSREWLDAALNGADTVGFTWLVVTAFVRLSTKVGLFPHPLAPAEALAQVEEWLDAPTARIVNPTSAHVSFLRHLLEEAGTGGNLVSDAHLAALALEHRADIVSYDQDFRRFAGVRCHLPEQLL